MKKDIYPKKTIPIWEISGKQATYRAKNPVAVCVHVEDNLFIAENDQLSVYGAGNSLSESIEEFKQQLAHFIEYYRVLDRNRVAGEALRLKKLYSEVFEPIPHTVG